jgi:hypothetical protein
MPQARGTRTQDSMQESLKGLLADLAYMKTMPDADMDYLNAIEGSILTKLRAPISEALATAQKAGAILPQNLRQQAMQGMGGGPPMGPMGGNLGSPPQGVRGMASFPSVPPVD